MNYNKRKVWGYSNKGRFEYVSITNDLIDECLDLFKRTFCLDEPVSVCLGLPANVKAREELAELSRETWKDGASIAAIDKITGKVVSVGFNKVQKKLGPNEPSFFDNFAATCQEEPSRELTNFMTQFDSRCDIFAKYKVDYILEIMFVFTERAYRGLKVARGICLATGKLAMLQACGQYVLPKYPNIKIGALTAICSNKLSYRIARRAGFDALAACSYREFSYQGTPFLETVPDQKNVVLVGRKLKLYERTFVKNSMKLTRNNSLLEELLFKIKS